MKTNSNEIVTFTSGDRKAIFTVLVNFTFRCSDYLTETCYDLNTKYRIADYLHNPSGPAIVDLASKECFYFINGKQLTKEEAHHLKVYQNFHDALEDLLEE